MPCFDLPLEALKEYRGSGDRPADFDAYWSRAIAEMEGLGTAYHLEPADIEPVGAECFELWFTGVGGARVHAKYLRPAGLPAPHPAVVIFHGYSGSSVGWSSLMRYACAGIAVLAMDCRGQAGKSQDVGVVEGSTIRGHIIRGATDPNPESLLMRAIYLDCAQLARIAMSMPEIDACRVAAQGISQGGGLALACAALTPALNRVVSVTPFLCDYRRAWTVGAPDGAYFELSYYFRFIDPRHTTERQFYERLGYIDNVNLAPRIRARTLMLTGLLDHTCPPSTQFAAFNGITAPKRVEVYPDYAHETCSDMEDVAMRFLMEMALEGR